MKYRNFGNTGLMVSVISVGNASNFKPENYETDTEIIKYAYQSGVNYFDTAQIYGGGKSEENLGNIIIKLGIQREKLVIATKIWSAVNPDRNSNKSTNKKHIKESVKESLKRLKMDYVDIIYAHGYDFETPMQEICRSFHEVIQQGSAFYWATSNWEVSEVFQALQVCEKYNLHRPIAAQNQYHMLLREEIENDYLKLFKDYKYGLASWSSLAGGFLTGKYLNGIKEDEISRLNDPTFPQVVTDAMKKIYHDPYSSEDMINSLKQIQKIANKLGCKLHHLAIAWLIKFKYLSTAIIGARNKEQLQDTLECLEIIQKLTPQIQTQINSLLNNGPPGRMDWKIFGQQNPIRPVNKK